MTAFLYFLLFYATSIICSYVNNFPIYPQGYVKTESVKRAYHPIYVNRLYTLYNITVAFAVAIFSIWSSVG